MISAFGVEAAGASGIACAVPAIVPRQKAMANSFRMVFGLLGFRDQLTD
jgi:hypothetical protein